MKTSSELRDLIQSYLNALRAADPSVIQERLDALAEAVGWEWKP
jgi:hypothetical protein